MSDDIKVTISGKDMASAAERLRARAEGGKVKSIEDLLQIHNDEQTTKELNKEFKKLREAVDSRASLDEKNVKGELRVVIKYETEGATGMHEIEILHEIKLPKKRSNKRKMYEDQDGNLTDRKPSKNLDLFDNVTPINRKSV
jgi:Zn-finger protein